MSELVPWKRILAILCFAPICAAAQVQYQIEGGVLCLINGDVKTLAKLEGTIDKEKDGERKAKADATASEGFDGTTYKTKGVSGSAVVKKTDSVTEFSAKASTFGVELKATAKFYTDSSGKKKCTLKASLDNLWGIDVNLPRSTGDVMELEDLDNNICCAAPVATNSSIGNFDLTGNQECKLAFCYSEVLSPSNSEALVELYTAEQQFNQIGW